MKEKIGNFLFQPYGDDKKYMYVLGSIPAKVLYNASILAKVSKTFCKDKGGYEITIDDISDGHKVVNIFLVGAQLIISKLP